MDLSLTPEEQAFREEVRAFFRDNVPAGIKKKLSENRHTTKEDMVEWTRILHKKGWAVPHWPKEFGGTEWTAVQQYIFNEEMQATPAPPPGAEELARQALAAAPAKATYARVDMVPDDKGVLRIMELELIEPALFLDHAPDGGAAFTRSILDAVRTATA
jgi:alkylation response protein AidB-like acyl-CoA dehydrogenase